MPASPARLLPLASLADLEMHNVRAEILTYRGTRAVRLCEHYLEERDGHAIALLPDSSFADGVIEAEVAGVPHADALDYSRGFVGIAFRVQARGARFACFFLRPANGRAGDQLRRNHATQYIAHPDYPWYRLREEFPGVYESYVDLETGAWTAIKIVVAGTRAQLHVHGAEQPCFVVNDLKLGVGRGQIALWVGGGTDAYFSHLAIRASGEDV